TSVRCNGETARESAAQMLDLRTCWANVGRAREHVEALEQDFAAWNRDSPFSVEARVNADDTAIRWVAIQRVPLRSQRWALQLSDAFANLRCSLDHLVWAIAVAQDVLAKPNAPDPKRIAFPIMSDLNAFKSFEDSKLRNFSQPVRAAIEEAQPYNRRHSELPPL